MFWKAKVRISEENYQFSAPVMVIMRTMGLFPILAHRDKFGRYLQLSILHLLYSFSLGLFSIIHASIGLLEDIAPPDGLSIRIRTGTDAFVELFDWGIVHVVAACGFFLIPCKFLTYFRYTKCIEEIDAVLQIKHTKKERYLEVFVCLATFSAMTYQVILDYFTYVILMGKEISPFTILSRYGCNYFGCVMMMMVEYEFQQLGSNLARRIKKFNKILESLDLVVIKPNIIKHKQIKNKFKKQDVEKWNKISLMIYSVAKISDTKGFEKKLIPKYDLLINTTLSEKLYGERIDKLMKVYLQLCDALGVQNELLAISGVCAITAAFFHLIEALYFLLSDLTGTVAIWYVMQISWLVIHISRFILVIEPYHNIFVEFETTKALVCKLQSTKVGQYIFRKLRIFTLILGLRSTKFSLVGTSDIDRSMFTAIMGYATTYLVILLQYNEDN